jgi:hypothetical protein
VKGIFTQVPESELLRFHIYQMEMSEREYAISLLFSLMVR